MPAVEKVLDLNESLGLASGQMKQIRVKTGHFTINAHLNSTNPGERLFVMLHGARKAPKNESRAAFVRYDWDALYPGPILAISDPQTEDDWGTAVPRSGMYAGTIENDLVPEVNALIDKVCAELGLDPGKVVMYGWSAAGSAAILIAARRQAGAGVIAVCPGLRPENYRPQVVAAAVKAAGGTVEQWETMRQTEPLRLQPLAAIQHSIKNNSKTRFAISQCMDDANHMARHYRGLWQRFNVDPDGGIDATGHIMTLPYDSELGHGHEPAEISRPLLKAALDFFDGKLDSTTRSAPPQPKSKRMGKAKARMMA
jgi:pimeloyl-ACP methyl ester carboxylesterase